MPAREANLQIRNLTKSSLPIREALLFQLKDEILGKEYELSLVFVGSTRSRSLNLKHRGKDKPANVLSFPFTETSGEMFIDPREAEKGAPEFGMSTKNFLIKLYIHGLLHLKGHDHGEKMDKEEQHFLSTFAKI